MSRALIERNVISIAIAFLVVALRGGIVWSVLPTCTYISFDIHLFGLIAGIAAVWLGHRLGKATDCRIGDIKFCRQRTRSLILMRPVSRCIDYYRQNFPKFVT